MALKTGMNRKPPNEASPFAPTSPDGDNFQFSLSTLLLVMFIFSITSTALFWASQLPRVNEEIHSWFGTVPSVNQDGSSRDIQLGLLLFCYSSPLLMAGFLNLVVLGFRMLERRWKAKEVRDEEFSMEN